MFNNNMSGFLLLLSVALTFSDAEEHAVNGKTGRRIFYYHLTSYHIYYLQLTRRPQEMISVISLYGRRSSPICMYLSASTGKWG